MKNNKVELFFNYSGIQIDEIPSIPLYMDQLLSFIDDYLEVFKINEEDKLLTKTMINNYVKTQIINSPVKKKYTKEQLMMLTMIFHMKNVLSIYELKSYFDIIKDYDDDREVEGIYKRFREIEDNNLQQLKNDYSQYINEENDKNQVLDSIMNLVIDANLKKRLAEMLLNQLIETSEKDREKKVNKNGQ